MNSIKSKGNRTIITLSPRTFHELKSAVARASVVPSSQFFVADEDGGYSHIALHIDLDGFVAAEYPTSIDMVELGYTKPPESECPDCHPRDERDVRSM